jgi:hypothetical protein
MIDVSKIDLTPLYDGAAELVQMYKQELELQRVNASGDLSRSLDYDVDFDENDITLYFIANSYYWYIEHGRRPTGGGGGQKWTNSLQDIENWIQNKISRGWWIPKQNQTIPRTPKEIKSVAWVIRRSIHNSGFYKPNHHGLHILEQVLQKAEASGLINKMIDNIVQAYDNQVNIEIEKI